MVQIFRHILGIYNDNHMKVKERVGKKRQKTLKDYRGLQSQNLKSFTSKLIQKKLLSKRKKKPIFFYKI